MADLNGVLRGNFRISSDGQFPFCFNTRGHNSRLLVYVFQTNGEAGLNEIQCNFNRSDDSKRSFDLDPSKIYRLSLIRLLIT